MTKKKPSRRRFPRIPSGHDILVRPAQEVKGIAAVSTTHDVGLGGCRFNSNQAFGVGTLLWLTILPKKSIVEAKARVVYELAKAGGGVEIGVQFVEISDRDKAHLEKLLTPPAPQPVA